MDKGTGLVKGFKDPIAHMIKTIIRLQTHISKQDK